MAEPESVAKETANTPDASAPAMERNFVLWLTNVSHAVNHFQNQVVSVLYAVIMTDLGFGYAQLGALSSIRSVLNGGTQVIYGFLTPYVSRGRLLGIGNIILGIGTFFHGVANSYGTFLGARAVAAAGSSAQHPVGSSLLSGYFPKTRGAVLALNNSIATIGGVLAPLVAGLLLLFMGWRQVFFIVAFISVALGLIYLFFRNRVSGPPSGSKKARFRQSLASYKRVLRNRNIIVISLVMMVGAAGRAEGVNITYIGPHLKTDLLLSTTMVAVVLTAMQLGGAVGTFALGWLSDKLSKKLVLQGTLLLATFTTVWLAYQGAYLPMLFLSVIIYGMVTYSRASITQALLADSLPDQDQDAAFSVFFFIGFASAPLWTLVTGLLMDRISFSFAFTVLSVSYLVGMVLMFFVTDPKAKQPAESLQ